VLPSILIIPLRAALAAAALMLLVQRQPPGRRLTLPCTSTVCRISRAPLTGESPTAPEAELTTIRGATATVATTTMTQAITAALTASLKKKTMKALLHSLAKKWTTAYPSTPL
jgi:hypothetical protein